MSVSKSPRRVVFRFGTLIIRKEDSIKREPMQKRDGEVVCPLQIAKLEEEVKKEVKFSDSQLLQSLENFGTLVDLMRYCEKNKKIIAASSLIGTRSEKSTPLNTIFEISFIDGRDKTHHALPYVLTYDTRRTVFSIAKA